MVLYVLEPLQGGEKRKNNAMQDNDGQQGRRSVHSVALSLQLSRFNCDWRERESVVVIFPSLSSPADDCCGILRLITPTLTDQGEQQSQSHFGVERQRERIDTDNDSKQ